MIVANRKPAGAPSPLPNPTAMGTLPVMAVIGAALATAMKMTATMPIAPFLSPAVGAADLSSVVADSVVKQGSLVGFECDYGPRRCKSVVERRIRTVTRQLEERYFLPIGRNRSGRDGTELRENLPELRMNDRRSVRRGSGGDVEQARD